MSVASVSSYTCKARKNAKFMKELFSKQDAKEAMSVDISSAITKSLNDGMIITRAMDIINAIPDDNPTGIKIK